jgi:hypothetical protein
VQPGYRCGLVIGLGDDVCGFRFFPLAGFLALLAFDRSDDRNHEQGSTYLHVNPDYRGHRRGRVVGVIVFGVMAVFSSPSASAALRPEYDRLVGERDSRREAEACLDAELA